MFASRLHIGTSYVRLSTRAYNFAMPAISASVARQTLPAQLDRVEAGEEVEISRHGRVIAVLISPEKLRARRVGDAWKRADEVGALLDRARTQPLTASMNEERAEELIRGIRAGREPR